MTKVREAELHDIIGIVQVGEVSFDNSGQDYLSWDLEKALREVRFRLNHPNSALFVALDGEKVVGTLCVEAAEPYYSRDEVATAVFWNVLPAYRQGLTGVKLLKMGENWARDVGCVAFQVIPDSNDRPERVMTLLERLGYRKIGVTAVKWLT